MTPPQSVSISTATFIKAVLIILGLWFVWFVRDIVAIFVASLLLAALIDPFATWFENRKIPRSLAVLIVYVILLTIISVLLLLLVPAVVKQSGQLVAFFSSSYSDVMESFGQVQVFPQGEQLVNSFASSLQSISQTLSASFSSLFSTVKGFVGWIATLFVVFVLAFYMVVEEEKVSRYFKSLTPCEYQPYVAHLIKKMRVKMGEWLRGQIILGAVVGLAVYLGLIILGVNYALLLALIAGFFEVVPYVGPIVALVPALLIAFAQSPMHGFAVIVLYLVIQQIENHILVPKVMQKVTGLNPIISIMAIMIGMKVAGFAGVVLAIPLAMMGVVILEDLFHDATE